MMVSFVLSFFPRDVLDEILNLIESVSEDFPSYFCCSMLNLFQAFNVFFEIWIPCLNCKLHVGSDISLVEGSETSTIIIREMYSQTSCSVVLVDRVKNVKNKIIYPLFYICLSDCHN